MPGSSSWIPYAPQGVKGFDDDDDDDDDDVLTCRIGNSYRCSEELHSLNLQGHGVLDCFTLRMNAIQPFETSVTIRHHDVTSQTT